MESWFLKKCKLGSDLKIWLKKASRSVFEKIHFQYGYTALWRGISCVFGEGRFSVSRQIRKISASGTG